MEGMVDAVRRPSDDRPFECVTGARLIEGHSGVVDQGHSGFAHIEDANAGALVGEGDSERQSDMPTAANNHDIAFERTIRRPVSHAFTPRS